MNVISCKLHLYKDRDDDQNKQLINDLLPNDIKIIKILEVSSSFDSKESNNNREYHYIIPSFCFKPKAMSKFYF